MTNAAKGFQGNNLCCILKVCRSVLQMNSHTEQTFHVGGLFTTRKLLCEGGRNYECGMGVSQKCQ